MYQSIVQERGSIQFPEFTGERVYMLPFRQSEGLPPELARWQPSVDSMLSGISTDRDIFLMIDQSQVRAGSPQRRPGLHVDGYWHLAYSCHDTSGHAGNEPKDPEPIPGEWRIPGDSGRWKMTGGKHGGGHRGSIDGDGWTRCDFTAPEAIMLASSITAARAFSGEFSGSIGEGGDCSTIKPDGMRKVVLRCGMVYAGNVAMLHESLPVTEDCYRTLIRLNVPGWTP